MAVNLSPVWGAGAQLLDNSGNVLTGGKIYTYAAGTTTNLATFTSSSGNTANSNPIVLNSAGRVPYEIWLTDGNAYKFVLKDSNDTLIGTWDNLVGINSNFINYTASQEIQTATAGQTVFTLTTMQYLTGTNSLSVFVDGVNQYGPGAQYAYVETDEVTVTFASGLHVGAEVKFTTTQIQNAGVADASQISYTYPDVNAVTESVEDRLAQCVSVKDFGAVGDGVTDDTAALQAALDACDYVVVPTGTYRCDSMIELNSGKTLQLFGGASLIRMSAHSTSTDPVVWMKGTGCSFIGSGQNTSIVQSQNRCPIGVVSLGHRDMTQSHATVTYCTLLNMRISGPLTYGQTNGDPDVALYMANPQFNDFGSYFHNVSGLSVANANYGIWLCGWANANTLTNIQGISIGNTSLGVNKNAFIYCNGALDNAVSNVFFHQSPDSIGLLVNDYDNTGGGGNLHEPYANSFSGYVCEQGGSAALGLKALSGTDSFYEIRHNVAGGNFTYANFYSSNTLFGLGNNPTFNNLTVGGALASAKVLVAGATDDGVNVQNINGGQAIGATSQRTYTATGTITITVKFGVALVGAVWRSGLVELMFDGYTAGGANRQATRYYIPIEGLSAWNIGTPVAIYGSGLTITQTANSTTSVTFTVTGTAGASGINSIFATATSNTQARLD